jgi:tRNA (cytidine56-2'-O)-methyltransferase
VATGSSDSKRKRPRSSRPRVSVLRVGHRVGRDPRLTTHLALAARAFGAERMFLEPPDRDLATRVAALGRGWGGTFVVEGVDDWKGVVRSFGGVVAHLTMYGQSLERVLPRLRRAPQLLLVVGGAKVPPDLYRLAHVNVAVGHQPHSEVAAVAIVLERLFGVPGPRHFSGAHHRVVPRARGKKVEVVRGGK